MTDVNGELLGISCARAAKLLGVSESTVRRRVRDGDLPAVGLGHRLLIDYRSLVAAFDAKVREGQMEAATR